MLSFDLAYARGSFQLAAKAEFDSGVVGICGASGSGKSTLLGLLAGLLRPDSGTLRCDDQVLVDTARNIFVPAWERHFGLVFQDGQLFPHLTVRRNLLYGFERLQPVLELALVLALGVTFASAGLASSPRAGSVAAPAASVTKIEAASVRRAANIEGGPNPSRS